MSATRVSAVQTGQAGTIGLVDELVAVDIPFTGNDLEQAAELLPAAGGVDRADPGALRDAGLLADVRSELAYASGRDRSVPSWAGMISTLALGLRSVRAAACSEVCPPRRFWVMMRDRPGNAPFIGPREQLHSRCIE